MVPVLDKNKKPLMPCSEKRARKLLERKEAKPYWYKGIFSIILQRSPVSDYKQDVCIGIDPGSKMSGLTVKSESHTLFNLQYSAPDYIKRKVEGRKRNRKCRRERNTPYRKRRYNRCSKNEIPPSTKARWQQHLNLIKFFNKIYPITHIGIEDIKAKSLKGAKKWNINFTPLQVGKNWFYKQVEKKYKLYTYSGYETFQQRNAMNLKKSKEKLKVVFNTHCVDSWVIANMVIGGHIKPENERLTYFKPLIYYKRKLQEVLPKKNNFRRKYGGTISLGLKRGTLVRHPKWGKTIVGGESKNRVSLHLLNNNTRVSRNAKAEDLEILTTLKWSIQNKY